jgi:hypothetical protein
MCIAGTKCSSQLYCANILAHLIGTVVFFHGLCNVNTPKKSAKSHLFRSALPIQEKNRRSANISYWRRDKSSHSCFY